jgi:signal transduction histidine kinase
MSNWSMRTRFIAAFSVIIAIMGTMGVISYARLHAIRAEASFLEDDALPGVLLSGEISISAKGLYPAVLTRGAAGDAGAKVRATATVDRILADLAHTEEQYERTIRTDSDRRMFTALRSSQDQFVRSYQKAIQDDIITDSETNAETPIIVLSTKEDARIKRDAFEKGASDYLVKLPDRVELLARVRYHSEACLNQRRRAEIAAALRASQRALAQRVSELQSALDEIEQLQRSKADFYSMVTHDLRNPAGNVLVAARMLLQEKGGPLTPRQGQLVQITATAGEKLLRLITDYLDFAKIDAGYLRLDREQTDLVAVVRHAAQAVEPHVEVKRQTLQVDVPVGLVSGIVDGPKLEQSLENLLSNAIKYTADEGRITLTLTSAAGRARIAVRDTGAGIAPELLPTLFAKYHRLPGEATRSASGTGLGLLIAKEIVEGHGGTIDVSSTGVPGEGTTFVIDVPLVA